MSVRPCQFQPECLLLFTRRYRLTLVEERPEDGDFVRQLQSRDEAGLASLYDRYAVLAFTLAYRMLSDRQTAEDVVQDAFLSVWRHATRYDPEQSSFRSWLITIIRNRCFDKLRSRATQPQLSPEADISEKPGTQDVLRDVSQAFTARSVRSALEQLPPEQRETIELAYYGGFSQTEISERMRVPLGTVKGRVRMGMQRLRSLLADLERES